MSKPKRPDPDSPQERTRGAAFRAGMWLPRRDIARGANEGLGGREIRALSEENSRPWGQDIFARGAIEDRCKEAEQRRGGKR